MGGGAREDWISGLYVNLFPHKKFLQRLEGGAGGGKGEGVKFAYTE